MYNFLDPIIPDNSYADHMGVRRYQPAVAVIPQNVKNKKTESS